LLNAKKGKKLPSAGKKVVAQRGNIYEKIREKSLIEWRGGQKPVEMKMRIF
jgi:hypothetical protein